MTDGFEELSGSRKMVAHLRGKKLTEPEIRALTTVELLSLCICDVQIPGPIVVDPECPVHWDMAEDGKPTVLGGAKSGQV